MISGISGVYIFIGFLILAGTICQGTIGFGLGTIATPILTLVKPELVPTLILMLALVIASITTIKTHEQVAWKVVAISSLARLPGTLLGAWAVATLSHDGLSLIIGCAVILAMSLSGLGWSPQPNTRNTVVAGVASGFLGTSTSIGGPPMALIMKRFDPRRVRGTLSATFVLGCIISLITLGVSGQITMFQLKAAAAYLPLTIIGLIAANYLNRYINSKILNRVVLVVAISAAAILIVQSLFF
ncbi:sulfite exporter TauE/SafE family protein [Corynebacterium striatum]|uniref:sulfite exporter TauE/SafE family protein n=1 Tax=Corynebacterium striatum TaxID=43770 RepID=UPI00254C3E1F|nr:sulfite exporter TauE/SafE family protein [Corynebacterium striatum]MDK7884212.1 sulfite exporter TauE/SafE family protein [Corynebacterium striatum]